MKGQHPDRDSLSAYLEEALSIDATQWIKQHLAGCKECVAKLEEERVFLGKLGDLCHKIEPPPDFTESVMARIAQQPAHRPAADLSWRRMGLWAAMGAAAFVVFFAILGGLLSLAGPIEVPEGAGGLTARGVSVATEAYKYAKDVWTFMTVIGGIAMGFLWGVVNMVREAHLGVQVGLLLATVVFNYWLTRMVLSYQRRQ